MLPQLHFFVLGGGLRKNPDNGQLEEKRQGIRVDVFGLRGMRRILGISSYRVLSLI